MKKELSILSFLISLIIFLSAAHAATDIGEALDKVDSTTKKVDSTINKIPKTPEEIRDLYLKQEWNKTISDNKVVGPIHKAFLSNQWIFTVLLNHQYEISLTFFCILFLWLWVTIFLSKSVGASELIGGAVALVLAVCGSIIIAQLGIINLIVNYAIYFILSKETWWARILMSIIVIAILIFLSAAGNAAGHFIKRRREKLKEELQEHRIEKSEKFIEGVAEGQKTLEEIQSKYPASEGWKQAGATRFRKNFK